MHRHQVCCFGSGCGTAPFSVPGPGLPSGGALGVSQGGIWGWIRGSPTGYFDPNRGLEVEIFHPLIASQQRNNNDTASRRIASHRTRSITSARGIQAAIGLTTKGASTQKKMSVRLSPPLVYSLTARKRWRCTVGGAPRYEQYHLHCEPY